MNQRTALIAAVMVTSFVLVAVGGVTATMANKPAATATEAPAQPTAAPMMGVDPAVVAQREVDYQRQIAQANSQLQHAYQVQKALADELKDVPPTPTQKPHVYVKPTQTKPLYPVTPEMAGQLALNAAPGATLLARPELVLFEGKVAYEVVLDRGKIYIDATTGQVLYNGTSNPSSGGGSTSASNPPPPQQHSGGEHEGGDGGNGGGNGGGDGGGD